MTADDSRTASPVPGALCLVLHSHLPWLPHHGVWPLGEEWLHQAWVESYVPLVAELDALAAEGHRDVLTLGVTPVLAAQLDDPYAVDQARTWAALWQLRCRELGAGGGDRLTRLAALRVRRRDARRRRRWSPAGAPAAPRCCARCATPAWWSCSGGPATHPFLPLLLPEMVDVALAWVSTTAAGGMGAAPAGIWSPECGYRPGPAAGTSAGRAYATSWSTSRRSPTAGGHACAGWTVDGTDVVAVPRDLEVTNLIWSSRSGYPTAGAYRDFHAREPFTGAHLWAITGQDVPPSAKAPYDPDAAAAQVARDVASFVAAVSDRLTGCTARRPAGSGRRRVRHRAVRPLVARGTGLPRPGRAGPPGGRRAGDHPRAGPGRRPRRRAAGARRRVVGRGQGLLGVGRPAGVLDRHGQRRAATALALPDGRRTRRRAARLRRPDLDQLLRTLLNALSSDWAFMVTRDQAVDYARAGPVATATTSPGWPRWWRPATPTVPPPRRTGRPAPT